MYDAVDMTDVDQQPAHENSVYYYIYFIAFIGMHLCLTAFLLFQVTLTVTESHNNFNLRLFKRIV